MRLFISYARIDKPYCEQIVGTLDVHEVWFDQRVHVGTHWWSEILSQLKKCQGFVYLLSPESVKSEYCRKEFEIAYNLGKHIFPVLIHNRTPIPTPLKGIQYVDLSKGLTPEAVKQLLNSILLAERRGQKVRRRTPVPVPVPEPPAVNPQTVIDEVAQALDASEYDRAVFLLKRARASGYESRFIDIEAVLREAEALLEEQAYLREAEREYMPIASLAKRERTRQLGCKAFQAFRKHFPDYDPQNISAICAALVFPMLEWCDIPAGKILLEYSDQQVTSEVAPFRMSKYPITNAQYQVFVDAPDGYSNPAWWEFSPRARQWLRDHPEPLRPKFAWEDHPRANVCWYEAMAFCNWLSVQTGLKVTLPTEEQWQWAAQGPEGWLYPWGNTFDPNRCNTSVSKIRMTTPVTRYEKGAGPFGVIDMAGNVWEWCLNVDPASKRLNGKAPEDVHRAVRGGSFISAPNRAQSTFHFYLNPVYFYATIGFRVVCEAK